MFKTINSLSQDTPWFGAVFSAPRLLSIGIHVMLVGIALIPWTSERPPFPKLSGTTVMLYARSKLVLNLPQDAGRSGGGGGGGRRAQTPASMGQLPRPADKQFVPPDPEPPKNPKPDLIMESTIVAPQLRQLPQLTLLNLGDPYGVPGPPSSGPGDGNGIGDSHGHGVGPGKGPGFGPGSDGGFGGDVFHIGGDVSAPVIIHRVEPEYSEEARKARYQGTVILQAIVRKDGHVDVLNLVRSLGFGLDQNAIQALKQWRFRPAMKDGMPVDSVLNVEVSFNIR